MTKQIIVFVAAILCTFQSTTFAQDEPDAAPKSKIFEHQIGVQVNELVRQVFNFNNTNSNINNPYLLIYSLSLAKSGWGIRLGVGPDFKTFKDDDGITQRDNNVNKLNLRFGLQKSFKLSDKWSAGAGVDGVYFSDVSYSKTFVRAFDSTYTDLSTQTTTKGYGGMAWLRYKIAPRVLIGTEASFYYRSGDNKQTIEVRSRTGNGFGQPQFVTTTSKLDNKLKEAQFNLPMVFYLIVSF